VTLAQADFDYVRSLIRSESGMVLQEGKRYLVEARLRSVARGEGIEDLHALVRRARQPEAVDLRDRLVQGVLIGETQFFRDVHPFQALRDHILPELVAARQADRALNVWCAASSSGQEPYSVALVLADFPGLQPGGVRLIASDLSEHLLERARAGSYSDAEIGRGLPPDVLARHFSRVGDRWVLAARIRQRVGFQRINLVGAWPPLPRMDLVLLRNVLIYFDTETRQGILERLRGLIRPGGYLFFGTSESLGSEEPGFEQVRMGRTICYRRRPG
jgi:chemotaxis protein methyltransferase CheR